MATVTPNFNWPVPTSTDLVKDGATAIEALGDSIDASLVDLKGGTTGQVLSKNSNTDMDFVWVTDAAGDITGVTAGTGISGGGTSGTVTVTNSMATAIDAKGDLVPGTGADTFSRLAVGANGTVLTADSAEATGLKWATPATPTSGMNLISRTTFSNVATHAVDVCFTSTYDSYLIVMEQVVGGTTTDDIQMQWRTGTGTTYTGATYYNAERAVDYTGALRTLAVVAATQFQLSYNTNISAALWINGVGNAVESPRWHGTIIDYNNCEAYFGGSTQTASLQVTGFLLKSSASNITGEVAVYGLAK